MFHFRYIPGDMRVLLAKQNQLLDHLVFFPRLKSKCKVRRTIFNQFRYISYHSFVDVRFYELARQEQTNSTHHYNQ